ncbi:MAG: hypothetical protein FJ029_02610 [Actinobacteria bacterium]|nr:hypothetical protein [Actinomycetota bacterium]
MTIGWAIGPGYRRLFSAVTGSPLLAPALLAFGALAGMWLAFRAFRGARRRGVMGAPGSRLAMVDIDSGSLPDTSE